MSTKNDNRADTTKERIVVIVDDTTVVEANRVVGLVSSWWLVELTTEAAIRIGLTAAETPTFSVYDDAHAAVNTLTALWRKAAGK